MIAEEAADALRLRARFGNSGDYAQPLPDIEIILTDLSGIPLARRRLEPEDYLYPPPANDEMVISGEVITIDLLFDDPGRHATGFEINFL